MLTPQVRGTPFFPPMKVELIEKAAQVVGDNQLLVNIVSKRVQQLNRGADPYIVTTPEMQSGDIALTEIIEGKLVWHEMTEEELAATRQTSQEDPFAAAAAEEPAAAEPVTLTITPDL